MRSIATILLVSLATIAEAEVRFTEPKAFPDIGLEMPALLGASPDAVSMPRAESFLVTENDGTRRLEDRYDTFDLWMARTVRARWRDANGNLLVVARLDVSPPDEPPETLSTRADFERLKADGTVAGGMLPKLENAFNAIAAGVKAVNITLATAIDGQHGTMIVDG